MFRSLATVATLLIAGCTTSPAVPDAARSELAPTGKLRAGMNLSAVPVLLRARRIGMSVSIFRSQYYSYTRRCCNPFHHNRRQEYYAQSNFRMVCRRANSFLF